MQCGEPKYKGLSAEAPLYLNFFKETPRNYDNWYVVFSHLPFPQYFFYINLPQVKFQTLKMHQWACGPFMMIT